MPGVGKLILKANGEYYSSDILIVKPLTGIKIRARKNYVQKAKIKYRALRTINPKVNSIKKVKYGNILMFKFISTIGNFANRKVSYINDLGEQVEHENSTKEYISNPNTSIQVLPTGYFESKRRAVRYEGTVFHSYLKPIKPIPAPNKKIMFIISTPTGTTSIPYNCREIKFKNRKPLL